MTATTDTLPDDPGTLMPKDPAAMRRWVEDVQRNGEPAPYYPTREPCKAIPYSQVVFWSGKYRDGMPAPEITRVVQIDPAPTPILIASAPASIRAAAPSAVTILPATIGRSGHPDRMR